MLGKVSLGFIALMFISAGCSKKEEATKAPPTAPKTTAKAPTPATKAPTPTTTKAPAADPAHDPAEIAKAQAQLADMKKMCDDSADARKKRQDAKPLYERLGGRDAIKAVVTDVAAAKASNDIMKPTMEGVDQAKFVENMTDFLSSAFGGPEKYTGKYKDLTDAHAKLKLTDVHFMAAGMAVAEVLKKFNVPEPETQEVMCALVGAHDAVVPPAAQ